MYNFMFCIEVVLNYVCMCVCRNALLTKVDKCSFRLYNNLWYIDINTTFLNSGFVYEPEPRDQQAINFSFGPADTWSQMNQKHDTDTNSASSSVLFALLLRYNTPNIMSNEIDEEAEFVSVACFWFIWQQVSAGRLTVE